jgi:hypothetical protein
MRKHKRPSARFFNRRLSPSFIQSLTVDAQDSVTRHLITIGGSAVDMKPGFLYQESADLQVSLGRGEVQDIPPTGALGFTQISFARHF